MAGSPPGTGNSFPSKLPILTAKYFLTNFLFFSSMSHLFPCAGVGGGNSDTTKRYKFGKSHQNSTLKHSPCWHLADIFLRLSLGHRLTENLLLFTRQPPWTYSHFCKQGHSVLSANSQVGPTLNPEESSTVGCVCVVPSSPSAKGRTPALPSGPRTGGLHPSCWFVQCFLISCHHSKLGRF